jgi:hypothetical protein
MKKLIPALTAILLTLYISARGQTEQNEVGIVFKDLNDFGLTFKTGTPNALNRFTAVILSGYNDSHDADSENYKENEIGFGIKVGREWRKRITKTFEFRVGLDISYNYSKYKYETDYKSAALGYDKVVEEGSDYTPGINLVLGFNYVFAKVIVLGFEAMPFISYSTGSSSVEEYYGLQNWVASSNNNSGFSYGLSSSSLVLSVSYRFETKKHSADQPDKP